MGRKILKFVRCTSVAIQRYKMLETWDQANIVCTQHVPYARRNKPISRKAVVSGLKLGI